MVWAMGALKQKKFILENMADDLKFLTRKRVIIRSIRDVVFEIKKTTLEKITANLRTFSPSFKVSKNPLEAPNVIDD